MTTYAKTAMDNLRDLNLCSLVSTKADISISNSVFRSVFASVIHEAYHGHEDNPGYVADRLIYRITEDLASLLRDSTFDAFVDTLNND